MHTRLPDLIAETARQHGDSPALTCADTTLGYAQLWYEVRRVAAGLAQLGVRRDDRVAVYLDKRIETVLAMFGTSAAGGVFVPVNPLLRPRQVAHILADCGVRVLVTSAERFAALGDAVQDNKSLEQVVLVGARQPGQIRQPGRASQPGPVSQPGRAVAWPDLLVDPPARADTTGLVDLDMAAILYTSGSTGPPKGVVLSHRNLIVGAQSVSGYLGNGPDDVILAALPLSFDAGLSQLTTAIAAGAEVVLMNYLLPADVVRMCAKHRVTGLTCVPPLWLQLAELSWPAEAVRSLRYFANTGGRMPKATLEKLRTIFPLARPYLMYGLTEAFRSTYLDPAEVDRRPDSIGKAIPNAEVLVVRPDGAPCDPGEAGELVHRGPLVAMGYWNDPVRTAERFRPVPGRDEALCTTELAVWSGDTVVRDAEGFLYFVGRADEMIKTSGYRVSPAEIEEVVYDSGLVRDAVALGIEDVRIGQHVVLVVTGADPDVHPDALIALLRRQLPLYMVPRRVIVLPAIPRSPNGKFDRNALRQELMRR